MILSWGIKVSNFNVGLISGLGQNLPEKSAVSNKELKDSVRQPLKLFLFVHPLV